MLLRNKINGLIGGFANHQGEDWEILPPTESNIFLLEQAKVDKVITMKKMRDIACYSDIVTSKGLIFAVDTNSLILIEGAISMYKDAPSFTMAWGKTGSIIVVEDLVEVRNLLLIRYNYFVNILSKSYEQQINACTSIEDINSIIIDFPTHEEVMEENEITENEVIENIEEETVEVITEETPPSRQTSNEEEVGEIFSMS